MQKAIVFGAGQCGRWARKIIPAAGYEVTGFVDNAPDKIGNFFEGLPVHSPENLPRLKWDVLFIAMKGEERAKTVLQQLLDMGIPRDRIELVPSFLINMDLRCLELDLAARRIRESGIIGAAAELGVYRGDFAAGINEALPEKRLYLFDTFEGFCERDVEVERQRNFSSAKAGEFGDTDLETVRSKLPFPEMAVFRQGIFPETASGLESESFCLVSIDADLYEPVYEGLKFFYPRLSPGGTILLHDCDNARFRGAGEAVRRYCSEMEIFVRPLWDMHGSAVLARPGKTVD